MGNLSAVKEEMRDARVIQWLASTIQDLRHGLFLLWRDAGVSGLIVVVLALGIGGNTAIFTLMKAAFLDPLPYRDADRLITVTEAAGWNPSLAEFLEIRARTRTLEDIAFLDHRDMQISGTAEPMRVFAARVTASFFPLLGVNADIGRTLHEEENRPGRAPVVVLSHSFWRTQLGADAAIVGRTLRLDGEPALVVGVLPDGFHFDYPTLRIPEPVDIYVSLPVDTGSFFRSRVDGSRVLGRLHRDTAPAEAGSEFALIGRALAQEHPETYRDRDGKSTTPLFTPILLRDAIIGTQRSLLWLLLGGLVMLLLIACTNAAQLLLARTLRRQREIAVRAALGASRSRLIRQFLAEGTVLAICGGIAGVFAATWLMHVLIAVLPRRSPLFEAAHLDLLAIGFTLALSLVCAMVFAAVPAMKGSRWTPGPDLTVRMAIGEGNNWRHAMIAIEVALSMLLLCGAGIVTQNLWALRSTHVGFDPTNVLVMQLKLPALDPGSLTSNAILPVQEYLDRIAVIPGVDSAATVTGPPLRPARGGPTEIVGQTNPGGSLRSVIADNHIVSPDYFRTLRIPLLAGRTFVDDDRDGQPWVAIVSEEFARRFDLGTNVVGKQIFEPGEPITIVGMVGNVRTRGLSIEPTPEVYLSSLQFAWSNVYLVVRSSIPPSVLIQRVKAAIASSNSDQAVFGVMTMDEFLNDAVVEPRFHVFLIGSFAVIAVIMAAAGIYSVVSSLVSQRTNEIAIRIALGANRTNIVLNTLGSTAAWTAIGMAVGLVLGHALSETVRGLSNAAVRESFWMYIAAALFFFVVTIAAAYAPVRRATALDPAAALRL